jgi:hypothetical protein
MKVASPTLVHLSPRDIGQLEYFSRARPQAKTKIPIPNGSVVTAAPVLSGPRPVSRVRAPSKITNNYS